MLFNIIGAIATLGWCLWYLFAMSNKTTYDHILFGVNLTLGFMNLICVFQCLLN